MQKKLYKKYKDNEQLAFIGIAVSDAEKEWRQALKKKIQTGFSFMIKRA